MLPRSWHPPALGATLRLTTALVLIGVGLHLDHAHLAPGSMTWLGALLLVALAAPDILRARRAWLSEGQGAQAELLPEVQMALQLQTLAARLGPAAAFLAVEATAQAHAQPKKGDGHGQH